MKGFSYLCPICQSLRDGSIRFDGDLFEIKYECGAIVRGRRLSGNNYADIKWYYCNRPLQPLKMKMP